MRILWLKTELLHPLDKGGRIRSYHMLRAIRRDHEVHYVALDDGSNEPEALQQAAEYADDVLLVPHRPARKGSLRFYRELTSNLRSPLPYFVERYRSEAMRRTVSRALADREPDLLVCDFLVPAVNLPEDLGVPSLLFEHNVEAEIWRRHWEVTANPLKKTYFQHQWRKARAFEARTCRRFDQVVAVSERDREKLASEYGIEGVRAVQTGVDTEYFRASDRQAVREHHIVFTGSMDWRPNVDAMEWFVREILPRIRDAVPDTTLSIVGRRPTGAVRGLESTSRGVTVTGGVPDVRPYLNEATVFVVPLRIGGGTRLKIYEAMAMELPVVSTSVGKEGLDVTHEEELLVADDPASFASEVVGLLQSSERARGLGRRAAARVRRDFGWEDVARSFTAICRETVERSQPKAVEPRESPRASAVWNGWIASDERTDG